MEVQLAVWYLHAELDRAEPCSGCAAANDKQKEIALAHDCLDGLCQDLPGAVQVSRQLDLIQLHL